MNIWSSYGPDFVTSFSQTPAASRHRRASPSIAWRTRCWDCARLGQQVAHFERELRLFREIGNRDAILRDARIDLHGERFGPGDTARRQPRAIGAWRDQRTAGRRTAAFHVAGRRRRAARVAQVPDEAVHAGLRRQRRREPAAAPSAAAAACRRGRGLAARVRPHDRSRRVQDLELQLAAEDSRGSSRSARRPRGYSGRSGRPTDGTYRMR